MACASRRSLRRVGADSAAASRGRSQATIAAAAGAGDRPRHLAGPQLGDDVGRRRAGSRPGRRGCPSAWSGCGSPAARGRRWPARVSVSPGTASMNASSTTTSRPGPQQRRDRVAAGAGRRSGWSGCRRRRGRRRRAPRSGSRTNGSREHDLGRRRVPACSSAACGSVNCGCTTTGRRQGRSRATQGERLGGAGRGEHLAGRRGRGGRRAPARPPWRRRVAAGGVQAGVQGGVEPGGPRSVVHVDGEVEQPVADLDVAVVAQRLIHGRAPRRRTAGRAAGGRPSGCAGTTRAGSADAKPTSSPSTVQAARPLPHGVTRVRWNSCAGDRLAGAGQQVVGGRRHRGVAQRQPLGHRGVRRDRADHGGGVQ